MAGTNDAKVVRTAGLVLCLIGCLTLVGIAGWNASGGYPSRDSLGRVSGTVVTAEVKVISTRTAIEKWVVIDVVADPDPAANSDRRSSGQSERWIFPGHGRVLADAVAALEVGSKVSGGSMEDFQRLRWSDEPVRVIWSLSSDARELVSFADVIAVEAASRNQSPRIGLLVIGLGIALILGSRIRVGPV